jgi:pyruvate dehydrogenase E1 component
VLQQLGVEGLVPADSLAKAIEKYRLLDVNAGTSGNAGGES